MNENEQVSTSAESASAAASAPAASTEAAKNISMEQLTSMLKKTSRAAAPATVPSKSADVATTQNTESDSTQSEQAEETDQSSDAAPIQETEVSEDDGTTTTEETEIPVQGTEATEGTEGAEDGTKPNALQKMQKRINKIAEQRNNERILREHAEQQAAELRSRLEALEAKQPQTPGQRAPVATATGEPFANHAEVAPLREALADVETIIAWADEHADGGEFPLEAGGTQNWSAQDVRKLRTRAEGQRVQLAASIAAKTTQLQSSHTQQQQHFDTQAVQVYPWMGDTQSPEFQEAQTVLRENPWIHQRPDRAMLIGDFLAGRKARLAAEAKKTAAPALGKPMVKPGSTKPPTPVVTRPAAAAPKVDAKKKVVSQAEANFKKSGSVKDLTNLIAAKQRAA